MCSQHAIDDGEECHDWEPAPEAWDSSIKHWWQARHIKVVKIAVTACRVPLSHTKFPFGEGEHSISRFMSDTWPADNPTGRPTYLGIDKGCKVMQTLHSENNLLPPNGWSATTNIKVNPWHYNSHQIDQLCITWCNPSDRRDPNLIEISTAPNKNTFARSFNFKASEHLNAWLEPFSATFTKMRPDNHDLFMCIILQVRAEELKHSATSLVI
ncbi:hypothetical protein FIBSPDRAFT_740505 [Athelia psychrophila]|uniref:Uncharacterized protein n=1 Tax=Athelia psychrophila TaxID=1759441 RepID=A0A166K0X5_9AGAM|nr:hypothetical protein FIBSPDRAFT_740505 [Fibularhizoctonia sp. CBS 109695]